MRSPRNKFTLIELLAALAVFSILAALVMQFFSGAQRLWLSSERRSNTYAEARASMEVVNELLSSLVFCEGNNSQYDSFFQLDNTAAESRLFFMTKSKMPLPQSSTDPKSDIRFVGILRGESSGSDVSRNPLYRLYLTVFCDCDSCNPSKTPRTSFLYAGLFTPYGVYTGVNERNHAKNQLTGASGKLLPASAVHKTVLMERVIDFSVTAMDSAAAAIAANSSDYAAPPAMVQLRITQMDTAENLEKWAGLSGSDQTDFAAEHARTFTRAFYLGYR